jgi:hypothetical protein
MKGPERDSFVERWLSPKHLFRRHLIARTTLERFNGVVVHYNSPAERREAFVRTQSITGEIETLVSKNEAYQLFSLVRRLHKVPGALAEERRASSVRPATAASSIYSIRSQACRLRAQ